MSAELVPYNDIEKMGKAVAESGLFGLKTSQQAIALMLVAQALGKHPALAAMEYNIIQGRPAKKAEAIQADFQAAGGKIEWHTLTDEKAEATFSHPSGGSLRLDWTMDRAKKARLTDKEGSMYTKYPRQMLKARLVADGVRAVYPAAMGGVRAVEEIDDSDVQDVESRPATGKSRVEAMVEQQTPQKEQVEEAVTTPVKKAPESTSEPVKKEKAKKEPTPIGTPEPSASGVKSVMGVITEQPRTGNVEGKGTKYSFKIEDKFYGTFDTDMVTKIMECVDKRIAVKFEYTERKNADGSKTFQDIVSFKQVSTDDVDISKEIPI